MENYSEKKEIQIQMGSSSSSNKDDEYTKNIKSIFLDEADLGYREAFNIFDVAKIHKIQRKEVDKVIASFNSDQSDDDEGEKDDEIIINIEDDKSDESDKIDKDGYVVYSSFKKLIDNETKEPPLNMKIKNAFSVFDKKNNKYISKNQIRYLLSSIGDKLTEDEVNEFMHEIDDQNDNVDYSKLAADLCKNEIK